MRAAPLALALALAAGCGGGSAEIPVPDLDGVESEIVDAVGAARDAVRGAPRSAAAWGALGDRYLAHEWFDEAALCYRRAAQLDPRAFAWPYRLGLSSAGVQDLETASAALARAVELKQDYAPAHGAYGEVLARLGRTDEARGHYLVATRLNPRLSHPWVGLGQLALADSDLEQARRYLEQALRHNPQHAEAHHALAQVYMGLGMQGLATSHADRARELPRFTPRADPLGVPGVVPAGSAAHTDRATALELQRKPGEAERSYRDALRSNPEFMPAHYRLGLLLARGGRHEEAVEHLAAAARLKSTDGAVLLDLSRVLRELGRHEEAARWLERRVALDPGDPAARAEWAEALAAAGRTADARRELRRAREAATAASARKLAERLDQRLRELQAGN